MNKTPYKKHNAKAFGPEENPAKSYAGRWVNFAGQKGRPIPKGTSLSDVFKFCIAMNADDSGESMIFLNIRVVEGMLRYFRS